MKIFEADYIVSGEIRHEGLVYKHNTQIVWVEGGDRDYYVEILERGLNSDLEDELESLVIEELEKYKLKFEK